MGKQKPSTVRQLAESVRTPVERLLKQMAEAGLPHTDSSEAVSDEHKRKLLAHLQRVEAEERQRVEVEEGEWQLWVANVEADKEFYLGRFPGRPKDEPWRDPNHKVLADIAKKVSAGEIPMTDAEKKAFFEAMRDDLRRNRMFPLECYPKEMVADLVQPYGVVEYLVRKGGVYRTPSSTVNLTQDEYVELYKLKNRMLRDRPLNWRDAAALWVVLRKDMAALKDLVAHIGDHLSEQQKTLWEQQAAIFDALKEMQNQLSSLQNQLSNLDDSINGPFADRHPFCCK